MLIEAIERLATDPNASLDKLDRLIALNTQQLEAKTAYLTAFSQMRPSIPAIEKKGRNTHNDQHYAKLEDINDVITPILSKHGFVCSCTITQGDKTVTVTAVLSHAKGHSEETEVTLPYDSGAGRNSVQAIGSAITYGRRYAICALLNLSTADDDGYSSEPEFINTVQQEKINNLLKKCTPATIEWFGDKFGSTDSVPVTKFDYVVASLQRAIEKAEKANADS